MCMEAAPIGITTLLAGASKKAAFGAVALLLVLGLGSLMPFGPDFLRFWRSPPFFLGI